MTGTAAVVRQADPLTWKTKAIRGIWMVLATLTTAMVVAFLLHHSTPSAVERVTPVKRPDAVRVVGNSLLTVSTETPLQKEMTRLDLTSQIITRPVLSVTGVVLARIRDGTEPIEDRWQFSSPELSASYADWLRIKNEIEFNTSQLNRTRELAGAETEYLKTNLARLEQVTGGTVPEKDLRQAKSALLKAQIQAEKDIFGAESALRATEKQRSAIERSLSRGGIEPIVFSRAAERMVLVAAHVPEAKVAQVFEGQSCDVHFYGYPERRFPGHVEAVSSMLTPERRTLRVLFDLTDEMQLLKPGMFGEVGLGNEEREALLIPATAVLHIGRSDYVLVAEGTENFRVRAVKVGEVELGECECLSGLKAGEQILSRGAILLKSLAAQSLALPAKVSP
ncbi:MAG: efflux RND transporter periplasmic adaptor subunit [Planctomycetes bacterium]|nr:efflux RND transporter periplasmic adaptor subunit [Planctomycetota bacterium]